MLKDLRELATLQSILVQNPENLGDLKEVIFPINDFLAKRQFIISKE